MTGLDGPCAKDASGQTRYLSNLDVFYLSRGTATLEDRIKGGQINEYIIDCKVQYLEKKKKNKTKKKYECEKLEKVVWLKDGIEESH